MPDYTAMQSFSDELFEQYEDLKPTESLYIDLEGSGAGNEDDPSKGNEYLMTMCWPQKGSPDRFQRIRRPSLAVEMNVKQLKDTLDSIDVNLKKLKHLIVFSGGREDPEEKLRVEKIFGEEVFRNCEWINLHAVLRSDWKMKRAIRERKWVWHCKDQRRVRYSLEALEYEFGVHRSRDLRAHSNCYSDGPGTLHALKLARAWVNGSGSDHDTNLLMRYTRQDVEGMFRIAKKCHELSNK